YQIKATVRKLPEIRAKMVRIATPSVTPGQKIKEGRALKLSQIESARLNLGRQISLGETRSLIISLKQIQSNQANA
ncbi:MAG: hypothetical protein P8O08_12630, partial [Paracoccaceae bacterium]|nr:hypothetical protein [Paracoccaceae bacterium]